MSTHWCGVNISSLSLFLAGSFFAPSFIIPNPSAFGLLLTFTMANLINQHTYRTHTHLLKRQVGAIEGEGHNIFQTLITTSNRIYCTAQRNVVWHVIYLVFFYIPGKDISCPSFLTSLFKIWSL